MHYSSRHNKSGHTCAVIPFGVSGYVPAVPEIWHALLFGWNSWHVCEEQCYLDGRQFALRVYIEKFPRDLG